MTASRPALSDIKAAHNAISEIATRTPLILSELSNELRAPLWLKLECVQPTGSFKIRGAANAISKLDQQQKSYGVVCASTGNHGRAVAYAAGHAGVKATVCLSNLVPENKVRAIESLGAAVIRVGESQDDAQLEVDRLVAEKNMSEIPPFDHFDVVSGQGTVALEILDDRPEVDTLLVPLSGGGLISGVALGAKALKPEIRIVGLSMDRGAAMAASLDAGEPVEVTEVASLADSLGGGIGLRNQFTFEICRELVDDVVLLTENEIYDGMRALFYTERLVAEGAAAVGHAAIIANKIDLTGPTAIVLSGRNVDTKQFSSVVAGNPIQLDELSVTGARV